MKRIRFNIITKEGVEEPWTGVFSQKEAEEWKEKHLKFHVNRGHEIVERETLSENDADRCFFKR